MTDLDQQKIQRLHEIAKLEVENGDFVQAKSRCDLILEFQPHDPEALHLLGLISYHLGDYNLAESILLDCLSCAPDYAEAHFNLGNILNRLGRPDEAVAKFLDAVKLRPDLAEIHFQLGKTYFDLDKLDKALSSLRRAAEIDPKNAEIQVTLGRLFERLGNLDAAISSFQLAIKLDPNLSEAYFNLHGCLLGGPGMEASVKCLEETLRLDRNHVEAQFYLAILCDRQETNSEARVHFDAYSRRQETIEYLIDSWRYVMSIKNPNYEILGTSIQVLRLALKSSAVEGLVLEFGVRSGTSIRQISALARQDVHGFDSFQGLPEAWHNLAAGTYSTGGVLPAVPKNVHLHEGDFNESLPKFLETHKGPVRFMNIDCDLYSSTKCVLDLIADRIIPGTVIAFDEYLGFPRWQEDEFRAFKEMAEKYHWSYEYLAISIFSKQVAVRIL